MSWSHRPALDGLRTVAVYLVVLFHSGIAVVEGGFIGVDLFFVLSGFLVSSILLDELDRTGQLRLGAFYARRVRRLLPAAVVVVVATAAVFLLVAPTIRRLPWVGDAQSALLYYSNWRFLGQSNDYFAADIDKSPYLHFWSLSIEEQFYALFPLLLVLLFRLRRRWAPVVVVTVSALLVASVAAQLYWAGADANHAYYGTDARLYQLLAGVLAALVWRRDGGTAALGRLPGWLFLAVVLVLGSNLVDMSPSTRGLLVTVAATGLVLAVMTERSRSLQWVLARPTMTYLGRISYGTYLWHWPVILMVGDLLTLSPWATFALAAPVATGMAALSFAVLERPIRRTPRLSRFGFSTVVVGVGVSALVAVTLVPTLLEQDRRPAIAGAETAKPSKPVGPTSWDRPVPADMDWARWAADEGIDDTYCLPGDDTSCVAHEEPSGLRVVLVGDSHARMLAPALTDLAKEHHFTLVLQVVGSCSWQQGVVIGSRSESDRKRCATARDDFYDRQLPALDADVVVLTQLPRDDETWPSHITEGGDGMNPDATKSELDAMNLRTMRATLEQVRAAGAQSVLMESILMARTFNPLECLSAAARTAECAVTPGVEPPVSDSFYRSLASTVPGVSTASVNDFMCPDWPVCNPLGDDDVPVWRDEQHYSATALDDHRDEIWKALRATGAFGS